MQLEYPKELSNQIVLFNCEWFDVVLNRGVKIQKQYDIVEVRQQDGILNMIHSYLQLMLFKCTLFHI